MINEFELNKHENTMKTFSLFLLRASLRDFSCFYECVDDEIKAFFCDNPELQKDFWVIKREIFNANKHVFTPTHTAMKNVQCTREEMRDNSDCAFNIIFFYIVIIFTFSLASLVVVIQKKH